MRTWPTQIRPLLTMPSGEKRKIAAHRAGTWAVAGLSLFCLAAHAEVTNVSGGGLVFDSGGHFIGAYGDFDVASPDDKPVSYGAPGVNQSNIKAWASANVGDANLYASATPVQQTLRASSAVASIGGTENRASVRSLSNRHEVVVGAGTTGLNVGDAITLKFTLRVDGTMALGNTPYPPGTVISLPPTYGYAASAFATMVYEVYDLDVDGYEYRLRFEHSAYASYGYSQDQYTDVLSDTFTSSGFFTSDGGFSYTDLLGVSIENIVSPVPLYADPLVSSSGIVRSVDTGYVDIFLDTVVGHTLSLVGQIDTEAHAWGNLQMYALSDFASTFDAEVSSVIPGVELVGLQAGVAAVPEADTWAMLLAGLGLVGFAAGRGRRR